MVTKQAMLAIVTAIVAVSAFGFVAPLTQAQAVTTGTPIPNPASCTYTGHPTSPLSQTAVSTGNNIVVVKHAEKELYNCIVSGSTQHYILDTTSWTTIREVIGDTAPTANPAVSLVEQIVNGFVVCAKDAATGTVYSCQTEPVGNSLTTTGDCKQISLGFPQEMNTVVINGVAKTIESQKEIFSCNTPNGPVIQEVIIWTITLDSATSNTSSSAYLVEICQKPATTNTGLPLLSCKTTGSLLLP